MPQVDLQTLVSACSGGESHDRKVACETLVDGGNLTVRSELCEIPSDLPPESFWLSKDAEFDWFDRNAFLERKESTKGINSINTNTANPSSNNSSQRFSVNLKAKTSIIGLPNSQKSCFRNTKKRRNNRPAAIIQLFPKKPQPVNNKSSVAFSEPSSPKVSCMGRVRSKRDKKRLLTKTNRQHSSKSKAVFPKPESHKKTGIWKSFQTIFRTVCRHKPIVNTDDQVMMSVTGAQSPPRSSSTMSTQPPAGSTIEPAAETPGLGGMKRFVAGRRSGSWTGEQIKDVDLTKS